MPMAETSVDQAFLALLIDPSPINPIVWEIFPAPHKKLAAHRLLQCCRFW